MEPRPFLDLLPRRPHVAVLAVHYVWHAEPGSQRRPGVAEERGGLPPGRRHLRGGAEKYVRQVVGGLLDAGAAVTVNYSGDDIYQDLTRHAAADRLRIERTQWLDADLGRDRRLRPSTVASRRRWFEHARPDALFVVQQAYGQSFGASLVAARLCGIPVVASIRQLPESAYAASDASPPGRSWRRPGVGGALTRTRLAVRRRLLGACCDTFIFNSRRVAEQYARDYGWNERRMRVIANAEPLADGPRSRQPPDPRWFLHRDRGRRFMIGCVGQLSATKGSDLALEAFRRAARCFEDVELVYFGDGPLTASLRRRAAELGLAGRAWFAGYSEDPARTYANIDLLLAPSRRESSSNAVAEAMARGLPCLVSDAGGLPEQIEHGRSGRVVPAGSVDHLARALIRLLSDRRRTAAMGDAAYARAARLFDPAARLGATVRTVLAAVDSRWRDGESPRVAAPITYRALCDGRADNIAAGAAHPVC